MCEPLFSTIKYVVVYSGIYVANVIVALEVKGVYAGTLVKNLQYCPKIVPGDHIKQNFVEKELIMYTCWRLQ